VFAIVDYTLNLLVVLSNLGQVIARPFVVEPAHPNPVVCVFLGTSVAFPLDHLSLRRFTIHVLRIFSLDSLTLLLSLFLSLR
jgi:hypothetical protein